MYTATRKEEWTSGVNISKISIDQNEAERAVEFDSGGTRRERIYKELV